LPGAAIALAAGVVIRLLGTLLVFLSLVVPAAGAGPSAWDRPASRSVTKKALRGVLRDVRAATRRGEKAVVVLDIDDTLSNGKARLRRAAAGAGLRSRGLRNREDMYAGLGEAAQKVARAKFDEIYNDPELAELDTAQRGAIAFVKAVMAAGGRVVYVSGRWESQREATVAHLRRMGLPIPAAKDILLNPNEKQRSIEWKKQARRRIARRGRTIAVFDNEAQAVMAYKARFPGARAFRLATFRFGDAPSEVPDDVVVLEDFAHDR
jgi:hypothetical protein